MNHELSPGRVGGRQEEISHVSDGEVGGGPAPQGLEEGGFCGDRVPAKAFVSWHNVRISEQPLRCREGCSRHSGLEGDRPSACSGLTWPCGHLERGSPGPGHLRLTQESQVRPPLLDKVAKVTSSSYPLPVYYCSHSVWKPLALTDMMSIPKKTSNLETSHTPKMIPVCEKRHGECQGQGRRAPWRNPLPAQSP